MNGRLRLHLIAFGALVAGALLSAQASAQNYPNHPITMIVPFAAGGLTDVPARVLAGMLQDRIGQTIMVENKPGGSGTLGGAYAARAAPDGYTLFANSIADAQNLWFIPVPYKAIDDFDNDGTIVDGPPLVLIVDATLPYKSLAELLADARANPAKISFGTLGAGYVARDGAGAAQCARQDRDRRRALCGLRARRRAMCLPSGVQGAFAFYAQAKPLADGGKVRALAIARPERIVTWPRCRPCRNWAFRISITAASSASRHPPRRPPRSSPSSTKRSTTSFSHRSFATAWQRSA